MTFNFTFWLSVVLAAIASTGLLLAGRGKWYGWAVGLAAQPVWAIYAIVTKGYGLLFACLAYGYVNAVNLWKWRKDTLRHQARDLYMNAWRKPIGKITSVEETPEGLQVRGRFNDGFQMPQVDPLTASIYSPSEIEWMAANPSMTVNKPAVSDLLRKDYESWQRDRDVHGTEDGSPDFTRKHHL